MLLLQQSDTQLEQTPINAALISRNNSSPSGAAGIDSLNKLYVAYLIMCIADSTTTMTTSDHAR
jgi:hypothetical protein